jgi:hypothetical protein
MELVPDQIQEQPAFSAEGRLLLTNSPAKDSQQTGGLPYRLSNRVSDPKQE